MRTIAKNTYFEIREDSGSLWLYEFDTLIKHMTDTEVEELRHLLSAPITEKECKDFEEGYSPR